MLRYVLAIIGVMCLARESFADMVIKCGGSEGRAYFLEGGAVPAGTGGWADDRISKGQIIFLLKGQKPQLLIGDTVGMGDVESDGAKLIVLHATADTILVLTVYSTVVETYEFRIRPDGKGEAVWTSVKATGLVDKGSVMRAECELTG